MSDVEKPIDVLLQFQGIQTSKILNGNLKVSILLNKDVHDVDTEIILVENPPADILFKARVQHMKSRLFSMV